MIWIRNPIGETRLPVSRTRGGVLEESAIEVPPEKWRYARNTEPPWDWFARLWREGEAQKEADVDEGVLCQNGRNAPTLFNHPRKAVLDSKISSKLPQ
jgi:hypothetical protein